MQEVRASLGVIAGRLDQHHPGCTSSLATHAATFFSSPDQRSFLLPVASIVLAAFALVLLICLRERGQSSACSRFHATEKNRASALDGREPMALGAAVADRESFALPGWRCAWICNCVLVLHSNHAVRDFSPYRTIFLPLPQMLRPNLQVLAYALVLSLFTGIVFGLVPALRSSRPDLNTVIKGDAHHSAQAKRAGGSCSIHWSALKWSCRMHGLVACWWIVA